MLPYRAALEKIEERCADYLTSIQSPAIDAALRATLRERRDYWHVIGSRIRRRMEREARRRHA